MTETNDDFPQLVVDFLRDRPNDEDIFEFADKHGVDRVTLAIQSKMDQVECQKQAYRLRLARDLDDAVDEKEATRLRREFQEWELNSMTFYRAINLVKQKLKHEFVAEDKPKNDNWAKQIDLLTQILECMERIEQQNSKLYQRLGDRASIFGRDQLEDLG